MSFQPIAIVGQGCVLPGALTPDELWSLVREGRSALTPATTWRLDAGADPATLKAEVPSDVGGNVRGFEAVWDAGGFALPPAELHGLDPVVRWTLHAAKQALRSAGRDPQAPSPRGAIVLGNLGYPTPGLVDLALQRWSGGPVTLDPRNRFMSGLPAQLVAQAIGFHGGSFALDAACASSLYAIKLACDRLQDGSIDLALAGGVNHADDLFLHGGFAALTALSPTGQSRPFHRDADGLVPARGAAMLLLQRLPDALAAGAEILGVIRGVGLSNDGRSRGLMVPAEEGQVRALRQAYEVSGVSPRDVSLVECHATGTPVGDGCELRSMRKVFEGARGLPIGSLKSNVGHLITASGAAAVIKVLAAMKHRVRPPTRHTDAPLDELQDGTFRLLTQEEPWESHGARIAAISNFGFGGNNAHLVLQEWTGEDVMLASIGAPARAHGTIAVVAQHVQLGGSADDEAFRARLFAEAPAKLPAPATSFEVEAQGLRFPPADLKAALPQQLLLFRAAQRLGSVLETLPAARTSLFVGMGCDAEVARHAIRWVAPRGWVGVVGKELAEQPLTAPVVVGCMPNIVANRIGHQLGWLGPSFTVSAEELSGNVALQLGLRALRTRETDAAVIGAVDIADEPVQRFAAAALLPAARHVQSDAAVLLVLKRLEDAQAAGDPVLALIDDADAVAPGLTLALNEADAGLTPRFGHAHAASGLLHVAAAVQACATRALPTKLGAMPWLPDAERRDAAVEIAAFAGERLSAKLSTQAGSRPKALLPVDPPVLAVFAAGDLAGLIDAAGRRAQSHVGALRLAIVGEGRADFEQRVDRAITLLRTAKAPFRAGTLDTGIHFGAGSLAGELAFVFTGAAGAYPQMGRELALAFPELVDRFAARAHSVRAAAGWVYAEEPDRRSTELEKLWGASYLSQLHAEYTRHLLGLSPTAAIGYCSGETNSLFALDVWSDLDGFRRDIDASRVYELHLCGELSCLRTAWKLESGTKAEWSTWRVRAPVADVRAAAAREARVRVVITNTPNDVVIAGDPQGCARVGATFGPRAARTPGYDFIMHCDEAKQYESRWRALHTRPSKTPANLRFYTHATISHYQPSMQACADALTGQAMNPVNFPALVLRAWEDGVRVFVEHGPHAGCTKWIDEILGERPHLAVALDRFGQSSLLQVLDSTARLFAAGVPVQLAEVQARLAKEAAPVPKPGLRLTVPVHPAQIAPAPTSAPAEEGQYLAPPPTLAPVSQLAPVAPAIHVSPPPAPRPVVASAPPAPLPVAPAPLPVAPAPLPVAAAPQPYTPLAAPQGLVDRVALGNARVADLHRAFLQQQFALQQRFVQQTMAPIAAWARAGAPSTPAPFAPPPPQAFLPPAPPAMLATSSPSPSPSLPPSPPPPPPPPPPPSLSLTPSPSLTPSLTPSPPPSLPPSLTPSPPPSPSLPPSPPPAKLPDASPRRTRVPPPRTPTGPAYTREQLVTLSGGQISSVFGPLFEQQDGWARQVRMPEPPLLLADRVLGIDGEPGTLGLGTIWTETDVTADKFYLHEGRMPAGVLVESGQADLLLISWLGTDFLNKGERVYRLLGCELKAHGPLPQPGETLHYQISVDGHAEHDGIRLFFFHYDCWVNGELRVTVRNGQAGFFTDEELANSEGVLWAAETAKPKPGARVDPPVARSEKTALSAAEVTALSEGRIAEVFGPAFARCDTHTRTPTIAGGKMLLLDEVLQLDPTGGPWKRGYLKARLQLSPESWFFQGHFKNDPCMPGTLMFEGGLQAMQIFLLATGHTIQQDGARFEPEQEQNYSLRCRGQATPVNKEVIYEIFVEELVGGAEPILYADILGSVDGQKAFHCKRMALKIVPAWPLDPARMIVPLPKDDRPSAVVDGFRFDYASLLACAWAKPSLAFGKMYERFDSPRRVARLPGPPYHFMSNVPRVEGPIGGMQQGSLAEIDYDVPVGEWYFDENAARAMPFAVLLEVALQPCGWLASYVGGALGSDEPLFFRNLDGNAGTQHVELTEGIGTVRVTTKLTSVSLADSTVIMSFDVVMRAGDRELYTLKTVFGFFPGPTMQNQAGLPTTAVQKAALVDPGEGFVDLTLAPSKFYGPTLKLARDRMLMIERITGVWPAGGRKGLGRLRAEKSIVAKQWFFKAHFFQDPVQPGSLGIEALLQALQCLTIELGLQEGIAGPRFETQAVGVPMSWKYRGQVVPENKLVVVDVELIEVRREPGATLAIADGSLWVDGKRIYEAKGLAVRIVSGPPTG